MDAANPTPSDELLAAILATGLHHNLVTRREIVQWADSEIESRPSPPLWLIELSLSAKKLTLDVISLMRSAAGHVDPDLLYRGLISLIPDIPPSVSLDRLELLANRLYAIAYEIFDGNWKCPLLYETNTFDDQFPLVREGYLRSTPEEVIQTFLPWLERLKDEQIAKRLSPVRFRLPTGNEPNISTRPRHYPDPADG